MQRKQSATSVIVRFKLVTISTGKGITGLTPASAGLIISTICDVEASATTYTQAGSTIQTIATLGTYAAPSASNCRFKEIDATNSPGLYEFQFADARYAISNAKNLIVNVPSVTGLDLMDANYIIDLVSYDPYDAVHLGLSAVPNATAGAANGLFIAGTNAATTITTGLTAHIIGTVDTVTTLTTLPTIPSNWLTAAGIAAAALNGKGDWSTTAPPAVAAIATAVWQDAITGDFTAAGSIGKGLFTSGNAPGAGSGLALVGSSMGAVASVTGNVGGSVASVAGNVSGNVAGNVVGSVNSVTLGVTLAAGAVTNLALASSGLHAMSDDVWGRDISLIARPGGSTRYPLQAIDTIRNKVDTSVNPAVIYQGDDSTTSYTTTLTTSAGALPIVTSDPT